METEKTAIAARMYIALRREAKRSIDIEWLLKNTEYAREVISLAKQQSGELAELAKQLEALLPAPEKARADREEHPSKSAPPPDLNDRYIGHLR